MKEQILKLRAEGKSYKQIQDILKCSKGTIAYHCGKGQKEKTLARNKQNILKDEEYLLKKKIERFKNEKITKLRKVVHNFNNRGNVKNNETFNHKDVLQKFGRITKCYLTGETIDLLSDDYQLDHIIPVSQGGANTLDNLGITTVQANICKNRYNVEEFINLCISVLQNNNYKIELNGNVV